MQNKDHHNDDKSNSEDYKDKYSKEKSKSSLYERRKTAIALSVVSSLILAGIGFEVISNSNSDSVEVIKESNEPIVRKPLQFTDENIITLSDNTESFDDDVSIIHQLTRQKKEQAKKIEYLRGELDQTQSRLQQLKSDILMRGGKKEQDYQQIINSLEDELQAAEHQAQLLRTEIANRDRVIANKKTEIEKLKRIFKKSKNALKANIHTTTAQYKQEQERNIQLINEIKDQFNLSEENIAQTENIENLIGKIRSRIFDLEEQLQISQEDKEVADSRAESLAYSLDLKQEELETAQAKIELLIQQLEEQKIHSDLLGQNFLETTFNTNGEHVSDIEELREKLYNEETRAKNLEEQLANAIGEKKSEELRAIALRDELDKLRGEPEDEDTIYTPSEEDEYDGDTIFDFPDHPKDPSPTPDVETIKDNSSRETPKSDKKATIRAQQDKLIHELETNLGIAERRNRQLENTIEHLKSTQVNGGDTTSTYNSIQLQLERTQERADALEAQLRHAGINTTDTFYYESPQNDEDVLSKQSTLKATIASLETQLSEARSNVEVVRERYESALQDKEEKIIGLNNTIESLNKRTHLVQDSNSINAPNKDQQLYQLYIEQTKQIQKLKDELSKAREDSDNGKHNTISFNEKFYQDRIKVLEQAYVAQEKALAQAKNLANSLPDRPTPAQTGNDSNYLKKIKLLERKNNELEAQLEQNNEYIEEIQNQLEETKNNSQHVDETVKASKSTIKDLEMQIALLNDVDSTNMAISDKHKQSLSKEIDDLNKALDEERSERISAEQEIRSLRERLEARESRDDDDIDAVFYPDEDMSEEFEKLKEKYESEKDKRAELEQRIDAMSKWADSLQNELSAYEKAKLVEEDSASVSNASPIKLRAKIAYLKTRLTQEKSKQENTQEQLQELKVTFDEVKSRNEALERTVHDAGLSVY
ncbi:MAG: hypothetical protein VX777_02140 [Chlamydiota bacterium]|nr:hypothetical protein [Chlamydiota bacterium]